ncbi:unnamed protein product [Rotaria socialis]|uniref:Uncharacterized protein n=1 Tax=Rotaria socialis TaxID=392032 RepID=A0A820DQC1_9BILA|nr:unnamed protein product [Rotaria socialis]CAF4635062.1 unnamed protein product [Rotaria socialis]
MDPHKKNKKKKTFKLKDAITCSSHQEINFNSVNHIHICYTQALNNCVNYFPNVTDLTMDDKFDTSITTSLNRIISLSRITKLSNH